jgi:type IV pilus assembly protein PilA
MLKPELKIKFLQHLNRKNNKKDGGFTLIELLVVVIIIGVLAAIALPSLLNQVSKARQSEGKNNIGAINRAQQSYFLENNNKFAIDLAELSIGIKPETENFKYTVSKSAALAEDVAALNQAAAKVSKIKSYAGLSYSIIAEVGAAKTKESLTQAVLCEAKAPNSSGAVETITGASAAPTATDKANTICGNIKASSGGAMDAVQ